MDTLKEQDVAEDILCKLKEIISKVDKPIEKEKDGK